jgi:hypothetical protein
MKPLVIDFAPRRPLSQRLRWFAGGAGALLIVVTSAAWLLPPPAEASHMSTTELQTPSTLPSVDEAQAVDAAVRRLNFPWLDALAAIENACDDPQAIRLVSVSADAQHAVLKVAGEARSYDDAQALPARLRALPVVASATLLSQEAQADKPLLPVRFALELKLSEPL